MALPVVTCESVVAEAAHRLLKYGPGIDGLCELIESEDLRLERVSDVSSVTAFMRKYRADFADASVVWLSEQYPKAKVFTVDFGDFGVYRRFRSQPIPLIEKN